MSRCVVLLYSVLYKREYLLWGRLPDSPLFFTLREGRLEDRVRLFRENREGSRFLAPPHIAIIAGPEGGEHPAGLRGGGAMTSRGQIALYSKILVNYSNTEEIRE